MVTTAERVKEWQKANPERCRQNARNRNQRNKDRVFEMYGKQCRCCGENTPGLLTLEHKDGNPRQGHQNLEWVRAFQECNENNWEVLCYNCNIGREMNGGQCPHQTALHTILIGV